MAEYLSTNPDYDVEEAQEHERRWQAESREHLVDRPDLSPLSGSLEILAERVDELKGACERTDPRWDLSKICFGTVPGGGLDAYAFKVPDSEEYAVVIPEGFFYLANLITKVVVLLQPLHGESYLPSAGFEQIGLSQHPYVRFRVTDYLRAFAQHGDPTAALPYTYALPYQDRFFYLLGGTELYMLAHEVGHVVLGHLAHDEPVLTPEKELEADAFALRVVASYFADLDEFKEARASLCGLMFNGLISLWESLVHLAHGSNIDVFGEHPSADERFRRFLHLLDGTAGPTPPWYGIVFNAVSFAVTHLPESLLPGIVEDTMASGGLHARVLPAASTLPARYSTIERSEQWWRTIADLILSDDLYERRLGLWFLAQQWPGSAHALYRGLLDDDDEWSLKSRSVLVSVEPMYEFYLPRLMERFRQSDREDRLDEYIDTISNYLYSAMLFELHPATVTSDPMSSEFLDSTTDTPEMDTPETEMP